MSLGYYHESAGDAAFDPLLLAPVRALGALGVAVVVSAGNDATLRPMYPAAFAPHPGGLVPAPRPTRCRWWPWAPPTPTARWPCSPTRGPGCRPTGPGAALVSTLPPFDAARSPSLERGSPGVARRSTIDPDDFSSGFGVWSGTSFASPVLAGEIAQHLHETWVLRAGDTDPAGAVARGWAAVTPGCRRWSGRDHRAGHDRARGRTGRTGRGRDRAARTTRHRTGR